MTPSKLQRKVVSARVAWVRQMLANIRELPLDSFGHFSRDHRNLGAADSYLRRALEALLDLGRHVAARGFGEPATEYKEIAAALVRVEVLDQERGELLRRLAGYRNRLVHFYQEVSSEELYEICSKYLTDLEDLLEAILEWIRAHPEKIDESL